MIPKKIHYCWFGGDPIPDKFKRYIESWKKYCPDYEIKEWNELNYDVTKNRYMWEAYKKRKWGFVPDFARLDIIYSEGGVYLDVDVELIKPLDDLLVLHGFMGVEKSSKMVALGLGFGAERGNNIIKAMMEDYRYRRFIKDNGELDTVPSPAINTRILKKHGYKYSNEIQTVGDITVFPSQYFCPMDYQSGEIKLTDKTIAIHHYAGTWQTEESHEIRQLSKKYARKFGGVFGIKIAKIIYYFKKGGLLDIMNGDCLIC
jgi:hypothetical protein